MKNYKTIIYIASTIIILGALVYFVYIPQIKTTYNLWTQNLDKKVDILNLEKEKANMDNLKKDEKEAESLSSILVAMLPDKKEAGTFIIEVEALAKSTNVSFTEIKFSEEKKTTAPASTTDETSKKNVKAATTSKFKELTFEMTAAGNYPDLMNFLRGLEKIKRAILIDKFDLSSNKDTVQVSSKGKIYYKND
jgi:Tfp pilus assembly protein PilO